MMRIKELDEQTVKFAVTTATGSAATNVVSGVLGAAIGAAGLHYALKSKQRKQEAALRKFGKKALLGVLGVGGAAVAGYQAYKYLSKSKTKPETDKTSTASSSDEDPISAPVQIATRDSVPDQTEDYTITGLVFMFLVGVLAIVFIVGSIHCIRTTTYAPGGDLGPEDNDLEPEDMV